MAQEIKPIDNSLFGNNRSWRDEARYRLTQALGPKYGELLGEGLLGESEEDKYLEYLQRTYGSTLPRNPLTGEIGGIPLKSIPTNRPMGEAFKDMSDLGALDQTLMTLSGGSSIFPKAAATAAGIETGALLGDAEGELRKGNPLGAGIMGVTAALPYGINRVFRGSRETPVKSSREIDKTQQAPSEKLTLYHGSGQDFDKFDIDKAGEGDLGFGVYFTPDKDASNIYTNPSSSKIKSMYSAKYVDDVTERRGGDPNPTVYKTEVSLSPDEVYQASKYTDQTPIMQSKIDNIINDFDLPPIDKTKTRGWRDLMDNLEEVGKVPEDTFSDYGIKAMKRDLSYSKLSGENTGKIYYSVFDDSLLDIVAKNDVPVSGKTPLLADPSRRQFNKSMGAGIATLGVMTSPLAPLLRRTGSTMAKLNPTKFLNKSKSFYKNLKKVPITEESKVSFLKALNNPRPEDNLSNYSFNGRMDHLFKNDNPYTVKKITTDGDGVEQYDVITKKYDNVEPEDIGDASPDIQTDLARKHFKEYGLELDDTYRLDDYTLERVEFSSKNNNIYDELNQLNADKGSSKSYDIANEFYVETYTVDGVPVVKYGQIDNPFADEFDEFENFETIYIPTQEALLKIAK